MPQVALGRGRRAAHDVRLTAAGFVVAALLTFVVLLSLASLRTRRDVITPTT